MALHEGSTRTRLDPSENRLEALPLTSAKYLKTYPEEESESAQASAVTSSLQCGPSDVIEIQPDIYLSNELHPYPLKAPDSCLCKTLVHATKSTMQDLATTARTSLPMRASRN